MIETDTRLDGASYDITAEKRRELLELFPEARGEGETIDFERLRRSLGNAVETGKERYGLTWPGKADCYKTIQTPSMATLRPAPEKSVNFHSTENLIIEGDNLEVLKLLQKSYLGKIKMIYIDPPYNTGNDFIYPDDYSESLRTYLQYTGQLDADGRKFGTNSDMSGRFHSRWLNMMYPRLYLARNLLRDDGVMFVTVDNEEQDNLKKLCNEVFGEENYITNVVWQKKVSPANDSQWFSSDHDYVIIYARNKQVWRPFKLARNEEQLQYYKNPDDDSRGSWNSATYTCNKSRTQRPNLYYAITNPFTGEKVWPKETAVWKYLESVTERYNSEGRLYWGADHQARFPRLKLFLSEMENVVPRSIWNYEEVGHTQEATSELQAVMGPGIFDSPKPTRLVTRMLELATERGDLVLDFFAGSGTTAHSVLELNARDRGNRKFILVQLPERTGRSDYPTIADIAEGRVRRVIAKLDENADGKLDLNAASKEDRGFRVFKLSESNVKEWDTSVRQDVSALEEQLRLNVDHLRQDRSDLDILFEIVLKSGFPLSVKVGEETIEGKRVYSIADGAFLICLERGLTLELLRAIAARDPQRVTFLDEGFAGNDQLKTNAVQTFKDKDIVFRTL